MRGSRLMALAAAVATAVLGAGVQGARAPERDDSFDARPGASHIPAGGASVPMSLSQARSVPVIEATINGKGPFHFIMDTGASVTVLDTAFCEEIGIEFEGDTEIGDPSGMNQLKAKTLTIGQVQVGSARFERVPAVAFDRSRLSSPTEDLKGVLGLPLFAAGLLTVDYPKMRLGVAPGELPEADGREVLAYDSSTPLPLVDVRVGDEVVRAHIDSGSPTGMKLPAKYEGVLQFKDEVEVIGRGRTVNNEFEIRGATLAGSMWLGGQEFLEPRLRFADIFPQAVFGFEMLKHFAVTFDQRNERVRFARGDGGKGAIRWEESPRQMQGGPGAPGAPVAPPAAKGGLGFMGSPEAGGIRVRELIAGGGAEQAGVRAGDLITAVNGVAVSEIPQAAMRERLGARPLRLKIEREGEVVEVVVEG